jgi:glycosyltransferase involved in cell wall biosynthesis
MMDHVFAIPAYGESPHLSGCIESILAQTDVAPRVLLTTSTPSAQIDSVAQRYGVEVRINPERANIATDWNFAMTSARAAWVTIAHQDDRYEPGYLSLMTAAVSRHAHTLIAFSNYAECTDQGARPTNLNLRVKRRLCARAFGAAESIASARARRRLLAWGNPVCCPSVMFNRERLADFRFATHLKTNLDWEAWLRLSSIAGEFVYLREPLVSKRVHAASETSLLIANRVRQSEDRYMFEQFWPAPVAALIMTAYRIGYWGNAT